MNKRYIRYIKKGIKILASAIIALLIVFLIGTLIFQLPKVKNYIANRVVQKVEEKNGAHLAIDKIAVFFYGSVHLQGLYAQDNEKDTLLFAESLRVNVSLLKILNRKIQINNVEFNARVLIIMQDQDSTMNFSPYIEASQIPISTKSKKQNK